jgi:hypothetical protein
MITASSRPPAVNLLLIAPIAAASGLLYHYAVMGLINLDLELSAQLHPGTKNIILVFLLAGIAALFIVPLSAILSSGVALMVMKWLHIPRAGRIGWISGAIIAPVALVFVLQDISPPLLIEIVGFVVVFELVASVASIKRQTSSV